MPRRYTQDDVKHISNWGYWWEVDGKRIDKDIPVFIQFPDGSTRWGLLRNMGGSQRINDMGNETTICDDKLAIVVEIGCVEAYAPWTPESMIKFYWDEEG